MCSDIQHTELINMERLNSFRHLNQKWSNGEHSNELLHAQAHIWNHIFSFINSMSLKSAIQLGIPDIINKHGYPMTLSELTSALPIHPTKSHSVYRLMRILVHSGFFAKKKLSKTDEEGYTLTDASQLLLKDHPLSLTPFLTAMLDPVLTKPWNYLSTWFQNDDPTPFDTAHGMTFWDYGNHQPSIAHFFNDAMASDARLVTSVIIDDCKGVFEGLESLVDVGGGTGTVAKAIADAFPHIECTVLDLPHVVADLQGSKNLKYTGGDMFEAVPPADTVLLKWILHDWNDEECVKILKRSREAITSKDKNGKVIIIDMMMENQKGDEESIETQLFFDMLMMALVTGKERNEKEWAKLFTDAGFSDYKITPILGLRSLIEVYP
ncbi:putative catechol O-methyltransferase [Rosa chinensis]|nr:putative catechol O-methyltransferase [Rosa chinensis]